MDRLADRRKAHAARRSRCERSHPLQGRKRPIENFELQTMSKSSEIRIQVELDDNHVPEQISWDAPDGGVEGESADALFLSVWNKSNQDTLRIDLWTKELPLDDMKKFIHQSILSMADTMERATSQEKLAMEMRKFARYLGEEMELIERRENDPQAPDSNGG